MSSPTRCDDGADDGEETTGRGRHAWTRVAARIGDVQARVILSTFYFVVLGRFALLLRWRSDPLFFENTLF